MNAAYWENRDLDKPYMLNGFAGTWALSDHSLIPQPLYDFIIERFYKIGGKDVMRVRQVPLEDINAALNEAWEGPGSMAKICELTDQMVSARLNPVQ
jgi:hypothetical protein